MKKFVIITDSCSDLSAELRQKYDIEYVKMSFSDDGKVYGASLDWDEMSVKDFYQGMRDGKRYRTAQVPATVYRETFEKFINEDYDILSLSCSSALSASVESSRLVRDELLAKYPDSKIVCVDTVNACMGLGLLCIRASELRAEGKTIEETADWVIANKKRVNQECTVDKLTYLKSAGRVSAASAFFGGLLSVKPIIISDVHGLNTAVEKVRGRSTSIDRIIERFKDEYEDCDYQKIFVSHADCIDEANALNARIEKIVEGKGVSVETCYIGPTVGASVGPGTLSIYFFGKEVTFDHKAK